MFAIIAIIAFVLAALNVNVAGLNMVAVGLVFLAAHMLYPWRWWSSSRPLR